MKERIVKTGIGSTIFILLIFAAFALVRPAYHRLSVFVQTEIESVLSSVEEKTGLSISYASLSPSILSAIRIKGIVVSDSQSNQQIISVRKIILRYDIRRLLKQETENLFLNLSIDGVNLEYNQITNQNVVEKIKNLIPPTSTENAKPEKTKTSFEITKEVMLLLPFSVRLRNISVHYQNETLDTVLSFTKIQMTKDENKKSVSLNFYGNSIAKSQTNSADQISFTFNSHTIVSNESSDISANLYLSNILTKYFRINSLNLLYEYSNDDILKLHTLRNVYPFAADINLNFKDKDVQFSFNAKDLKIFQYIYFIRPNSTIRNLLNMTVSFDLAGSYLIDQNEIQYKSAGKLDFPYQFIKGGLSASYSVAGDKNKISVHKCDLLGRDYDVSYSGDCIFKDLQVSGIAELRRIQLANGGIVSSELYFDPLPTGFMVFAPQFFMNDQSFTALQLSVIPRDDNSIDFSFEASDYSHADSSEPGLFYIDGSYLVDNHYIQSSIRVENLFMDSILYKTAFPLPKKQNETLKKYTTMAAPYVFNGELYISSDLQTVSYNVPYSIIANTQNDRQVLTFSLNGNNDSIQITQLNLLNGGISCNMTALAELMSDSGEVFFSSELSINEIPYRFSGTISSKWIDISGDYDLQAAVSFNQNPVNVFEPFISGSVRFADLPFAYNKYIFSLSSDVSFSASSADGFTATISRFELQEPSGLIHSSPRLSFDGSISKYGFMMDSFGFSDSTSALTGSGNILWNVNDNVFDSLNMQLQANSYLTDESLNLSAEFTNPSQKPLSLSTLKKDWYFTGFAEINDFPTSRVVDNQVNTDTISFVASSSGTIENPYLQLSIDTSSISVLGSPMVFDGNATLEAGNLSLSDVNISWILLNLSDFMANYSFNEGHGSVETLLTAKVLEQNISAPLIMTLDSLTSSNSRIIPSSFVLNINSEKVEGSVFTESFTAGLTLSRTPGRFDIYSSGDILLNGSILDDGTLNFQTGNSFPIQSLINGYIHSDGMEINVSEITANLKDFAPLLTFPFIAVYNGIIEGSCQIKGLASDPEFKGNLTIKNSELNLPIIIPEHLFGETMFLNIENSEVTMSDTFFNMKNGLIIANLTLDFDRWNFDGLIINLRTPQDVYVPADVDLGDVRITGKGNAEMQLSINLKQTDITGTIYAKDTMLNIHAKALAQAATVTDPSNTTFTMSENLNPMYGLNVSFDIVMGPRVQVLIDPFVRGVAAPGTPLHFEFDSSNNRLVLDGDVSFKGGELVYLNRNFYMREGRIVFKDRQQLLMDPILTVRAETRERDQDGNQVTVTLSADNQLLSMFSPVLSASPAKSENEIMELLGQIVSANSNDAASLLLATGDYAMQVAVMRRLETALRDLCNFDIFSIRTMVLQNAMKQGLNMNSGNGNLTAGNFFDNSTVYIGKYFGRELYADALLHWTYDEDRVNDSNTAGGIVFQPEFGFEMSSPYVNIRWGVSPDIDAIKENRWIPTTSVSLSWRFNF